MRGSICMVVTIDEMDGKNGGGSGEGGDGSGGEGEPRVDPKIAELERQLVESKSKSEELQKNYEELNKRYPKPAADPNKPVDPYDALIAQGVKPEYIQSIETYNNAYFQKKFGMTPEQVNNLLQAHGSVITNSSTLVGNLNYDKAKALAFDELQRINGELPLDYFHERIQEIESEMKPEQIAAIKQMTPEALSNMIKKTYYQEVGEVKYSAEAKKKFEKYQEEANKGAKDKKVGAGNYGGYSSNMVRQLKEDENANKGMTINDALNKELFAGFNQTL